MITFSMGWKGSSGATPRQWLRTRVASRCPVPRRSNTIANSGTAVSVERFCGATAPAEADFPRDRPPPLGPATDRHASLEINRARQADALLFLGRNWLGLHLGMSGTIALEAPDSGRKARPPGVASTSEACTCLSRSAPVRPGRFHHGKSDPPGGAEHRRSAPPASMRNTSPNTCDVSGRAPIKAVILRQDGFPESATGWRTKFCGARKSRRPDARRLSATRSNAWPYCAARRRFVSREALRIVGHDYSDPPASWLIHQRWKAERSLPDATASALKRATIGGRTTAWCARCQSTK